MPEDLNTLYDKNEHFNPDHPCKMRVLDQTGHTKISWDPDDAESVANARKMFDDMVGTRKYRAFRVEGVGRNERQGSPITQFDPTATEMMLIPQLQGG